MSAVDAAGRTDVCVVGGGPAGMMAGHLFARAGLRVVVLEKHGDFLRDFRGDTVHPSTLRIFSELGLLDELLKRPHDKVRGIRPFIGDRRVDLVDFSHFDPRWNFIAFMPQWEFLDFLAQASAAYPTFSLRMNAEVTGLRRQDGPDSRVVGVDATVDGRATSIDARLVIAADGRRSLVRRLDELSLTDLGAPMDVFWFHVTKPRRPGNDTTAWFVSGRILVLIDRGDYWQCAYVFSKGAASAVRERGLERFREEVATIAPDLTEGLRALSGWDDVKLLTVGLDRLERWHLPGLSVIGDAAHTMSPIGGVGINLAIQDAVAAANILAGPLARGVDIDALLPAVRARRLWPVRVIQAFQKAAQDRIIGVLLDAAGDGVFPPPWPVRLLHRVSLLRRIPAAMIGFGPRSEHVRSPKAEAAPAPDTDGLSG